MTISIVEIRKHFLQAAGGPLDPSNPADIPKIVEYLAAPDAVGRLAYKGQAAGVMALVAALPQEAQKDVLAAPYAVSGLADNGQAAGVENIKAGWEKGEAQEKARPVPANRGAAPRP
jgi:hypothetical protein